MGASGGKGGDGGYGDMMNYIQQAAQVSQQYTDKAISALQDNYNTATQQEQKYYGQTRQDLQTSQQQALSQLQAGQSQAASAFNNAVQQAGTYLAPYINTGLPALDAYADSMGLPRPSQGSLSTFNQQQAANTALSNADQAKLAQYQQQLNQYNQQQNAFNNKLNALGITNTGVTPEIAAAMGQGNINAAGAPGAAGAKATGPGFIYDAATGMANKAAVQEQGADQIKAMVRNVDSYLTKIGSPGYNSAANAQRENASVQDQIDYLNFIQPNLAARDAEPFAKSLAGTIGSTVSKYVAPSAAQSVNVGTAPTAPVQQQLNAQQTPIAPAPDMTKAGSQNQAALQAFYASPEAQAIFGGNPMDMSEQSVQQRFQNDPSYQFALSQGLKAVQNANIAKGLGYSPAMSQALAQYSSGLASQNFEQYRNDLANTFNSYQSKLAGMAGMGQQATATGAQLSQNQGQALGNLYSGTSANQANILSNTGQSLANSAMGMGSNLAQLTSNLGSSLAGTYNQAGNTQANMYLAQGQASAAQSQYQASQNAQAMGGLGALAGAGLGFAFGGPTGGMFGAKAGGSAGSLFSNFM